jgi:hypothetical protein
MKYLIMSFVIAIGAISCEGGKNKTDLTAEKAALDTANYTTIEWIDSVSNFGTVDEGQKVEVKFKCRNTGNRPLILSKPQAGCGCTTADYSKEPIAPGKEGWVTGIFNSNNQMGEVHKFIKVQSNTKNGREHTLTFTGIVNSTKKLPEPVKVN